MENMGLYNSWRKPPAEACKPFSTGKFSGTDISPMWRIRALTEAFGPCGIGWKYEITKEWTESNGSKMAAFVDINLYIKVDGVWSDAIPGTGGNVLSRKENDLSDEAFKMALTDAISIACKALGMGADVWWNSDPTSKYTQYTSSDTNPGKNQEQETREEPAGNSNQGHAGKVTHICAYCGKPIQPAKRKDGSVLSADEIAAFSLESYGAKLCSKCLNDPKARAAAQ